MRVPVVVGLYGRSLILESVGRRLEGSERFRVHTVEDSAALEELAPDVLMVDLAAHDAAAALALVADRPDLLLVGLDAGGARLLVLGGPQARVLTTDDLVGIIEGRVDGAAPTSG